MRSLLLPCAGAVFAVACAHPSRPTPVTKASVDPPARELFRFHVDFWANLHQVLFHEALLPRPRYFGPKSLAHHDVAPMASLAEGEVAPWQAAVSYYDAHFRSDSMFKPPFEGATRWLSEVGSREDLPTQSPIEEAWRLDLAAAAPVYRAHFWAEHERDDRAYVEWVRPRVAADGEWLARRLVAIYGTPWPTPPVDVEVTAVVPPFGASTMGGPPFTPPDTPLITVSSEDPGYRGETGLEMLFHEASHLLVGRVQDLLDASAKRQGRALPGLLWHFLIFYTAGHVVQERLGPTYVPYAERSENHIFDGRFAGFLPILQRAWQPYLDGHGSVDAAIDAIVAAFPAADALHD